ncbi:BREX system P-loop protein BrxC [Anaerolineales bacterium HSG25]|nr:BREX system P-loop protein BrxC [Anaerolineales bacterium HSG25]
MQLREIFETQIEEKIEPVIKVNEQENEQKLAAEIGSYVVTPVIERYLDDFLEHYTDTIRQNTTEIGVWISGYFGSGKSHLAKIAALLIENRTLAGATAATRFEARVPSQATRHSSILRSLALLPRLQTQVLAFNLNSLSGDKKTPLPRMLLTEYYRAKGYGSNVLYAKVIEQELDKRGQLTALHQAAERLTKRSWADIQRNPTFYARKLYQAACEVAPDVFATPNDVIQALKDAEAGELYNVKFLVQTILDDLAERAQQGKPCRLALVLDETGQWIGDDEHRLSHLQALVEEASNKGQGKIWIVVTTHEDMGAVYQNARARKGDFKKIEGRFRSKFNLTTENIELVLEDRIFKKKTAGKQAVNQAYQGNPGVLRDLGELKNSNQKLPPCTEERFTAFYPFFPYHIHLIPEVVKSLRSAGGRGEQLSGSTRTLMAITQDILRLGRRDYLDAVVGELVSFDEVYHNLVGEGEINSDVRGELSRVVERVPHGNETTQRVAEVLYLAQQIIYLPRTVDNLARLLVEHTDDDLATIINTKVLPELKKLTQAKMVAQIGDEYEFLTGERRTFEEAVAEEKSHLRLADLERGIAEFSVIDFLGFTNVPFKGAEFGLRILIDDNPVTKDGYVTLKLYSPLAALLQTTLKDLEDQSLQADQQHSLFVLCDRVPEFDENLKYYLAMKAVINRWKGDTQQSQEARQLATERENQDLSKLRQKILDGFQQGLKQANIVFRGSTRPLYPKNGQKPSETLRFELATFWPTIYPKYERVPIQVIKESDAIYDVLRGSKKITAEVQRLNLFDKSGQINLHAPLLDDVRTYLTQRQNRQERILGKELIQQFTAPPYGWNMGAVRVGIAALVRASVLQVVIDKKRYVNPHDAELQNALRNSRRFDRVELIIESIELDPEMLVSVRKRLIKLTRNRKIDETPAALSEVIEQFATKLLDQANQASRWAAPAGLILPTEFQTGQRLFEDMIAQTNPHQRIKKINTHQADLDGYVQIIRQVADFVSKSGQAFTTMRDFVNELKAIEYRLPPNEAGRTFLQNWQTALNQALITEKRTWQDLQNSQAQATVALQQQLTEWRASARKIVEPVLAQLPQTLRNQQLPIEELEDTLAAPLQQFLNTLEADQSPANVSYLPAHAANLVDKLERNIAQERANRQPVTPQKTVYQLRLADFISQPLESVTEWEAVRDKLDQAVKTALKTHDQVIIN